MRSFEEFAQVWRGETVESRHFGAAVVANAAGEIIAGWGDPDFVTYPRSAMKPFQALTLLETGAADAFFLTPEHLALSCASHQGEPHHTALAQSWLDAIGFSANDLACGPEYPTHPATYERMLRDRIMATPIHHNCSGKHVGFLTVCRHCGYSSHDYRDPGHPTQHLYLEALTDLGAPSNLPLGSDGCTLPTPALGMADAARLAARFAAKRAPASRAAAMEQLIEAMARHPEYTSGTAHDMVAVAKATKRRVVFKVGAEGYLLAFLPKDGLGVSLKVADGNQRARTVALLAILRGIGLLSESEARELEAIAKPVVRNSRNEVVGHIEAPAGLACFQGKAGLRPFNRA